MIGCQWRIWMVRYLTLLLLFLLIQIPLYSNSNQQTNRDFFQPWTDYWNNRATNMLMGGIDLYFNYPIQNNPFIKSNYQDIMGAGIAVQLPIADNIAIYNKFTYIGFNNSMKKKPVSFTKASLLEFYFQQGVRFHLFLFTILDLYLQAGYNYCCFMENAEDSKTKVSLIYGSFGLDTAGGVKIMFTEMIGIFAEAGYVMNTAGRNFSDIGAVHFNCGIYTGLFNF